MVQERRFSAGLSQDGMNSEPCRFLHIGLRLSRLVNSEQVWTNRQGLFLVDPPAWQCPLRRDGHADPGVHLPRPHLDQLSR